MCNPLARIWNYRLHQRCKSGADFCTGVHQNVQNGAKSISSAKHLLFYWFFFHSLLQKRVQVVQEKLGRIQSGRLIARAMKKRDIAFFSRYTALHQLGLLVFQAFLHSKKCIISWHILPASRDARNYLWSPGSCWENGDAPKCFFRMHHRRFPGANRTKAVPFLFRLTYLDKSY